MRRWWYKRILIMFVLLAMTMGTGLGVTTLQEEEENQQVSTKSIDGEMVIPGDGEHVGRLLSVPGVLRCGAFHLQQVREYLRVDVDILGEEYPAALQRDAAFRGGFLLCRGCRFRIDRGEYESDGEGGPLSLSARDFDRAAHHVDEPLCDRHAKARAAVPVGRAVVLLGERVEHLRYVFLVHPRACIADDELHPAAVSCPSCAASLRNVTVPPGGVNLTALPSMLIRICLTFMLSPMQHGP